MALFAQLRRIQRQLAAQAEVKFEYKVENSGLTAKQIGTLLTKHRSACFCCASDRHDMPWALHVCIPCFPCARCCIACTHPSCHAKTSPYLVITPCCAVASRRPWLPRAQGAEPVKQAAGARARRHDDLPLHRGPGEAASLL